MQKTVGMEGIRQRTDYIYNDIFWLGLVLVIRYICKYKIGI